MAASGTAVGNDSEMMWKWNWSGSDIQTHTTDLELLELLYHSNWILALPSCTQISLHIFASGIATQPGNQLLYHQFVACGAEPVQDRHDMVSGIIRNP